MSYDPSLEQRKLTIHRPSGILPHVSTGEPITACLMNELIDRVNQLYELLGGKDPEVYYGIARERAQTGRPSTDLGATVVVDSGRPAADEPGYYATTSGRPALYHIPLLDAMSERQIYDRRPRVLEVLLKAEEEEGSGFVWTNFRGIVHALDLEDQFGAPVAVTDLEKAQGAEELRDLEKRRDVEAAGDDEVGETT